MALNSDNTSMAGHAGQESDLGCTCSGSSEKDFIWILYALKCVSKYCNMESLKMVYFSHIHSHISLLG